MKHIVKLIRNSDGVTLLELLLAIIISTMVLGVAYGLLLVGIRTYEEIGIKQVLKDEADYVITRIMQTLNSSEISDIKVCDDSKTSLPPHDGENICIEIHSTEAIKISGGTNDNVKIANSSELKENDKTITQIKIIEKTKADGNKVNNVVIEKYEAIRDSNNKISIGPLIADSKEQFNSEKYDFVIINSTSPSPYIPAPVSEINATCSYSSSVVIDPDKIGTAEEKFFNKKCENGIVDISLVIRRAGLENDKYKLHLKSQFGF
ncbi:MAG TPA: hypothetical protein GX497_06335 [Bacillus bacterium]|nr:hypothetical protein [Bacillus sp. (in: firmicutes)]